MKVGIISEFKLNTVNYGNHLQAYALNYCLRNMCNIDQVESIALCGKQLGWHTNIFSLGFLRKALNVPIERIKPEAVKSTSQQFTNPLYAERLRQFEKFREKNISCSPKEMTGRDLLESDYDVFVVGSDVVWSQYPRWISRTKFLAFDTKKPFRRISYAASFGRDYIPKENVSYIQKYLARFDAVSVREHSSVAMLNQIGIPNVAYCLDPTLLLTIKEWESLEEKPEALEDGTKYVFTYLLGDSVEQRKTITAFAEQAGLKIATVPHANGFFIEADIGYGDISLQDCSIGNWLWLIHHAQYVITDSFHGTVFSTIFQKRFVVLTRYSKTDINNRMKDYLCEINQRDKAISADDLFIIHNYEWDYSQIQTAINVRRNQSIGFLRAAFGETYV